MRSMVFHTATDVEIVDTPVPECGEGEVLVHIEASAICGSELHTPPGTNIGHEAAGIVERAPDGVGCAPGDRVGLSAVTGCGECKQCRRGIQLYCERGPRFHGAMHADYVVVPPASLHPMPDGVAAQDAVLVSGDTLGVPARAFGRLPTAEGDRVLVIGLGPIGLGHTLLRSHMGAEVVAIEPSGYRRKMALDLGAKEVHEPGADVTSFEPNLVIECTGIPSCIEQALSIVTPGGVVLQSGECDTPVPMSPSNVFIRREIVYTGAWYYADEDFPEMLRLQQDGLGVERMVTHSFPADQIGDAFRTFVSKESGKVLVDWS